MEKENKCAGVVSGGRKSPSKDDACSGGGSGGGSGVGKKHEEL
jgi:hypothetical protein